LRTLTPDERFGAGGICGEVLSNVISIAAADTHSIALRNDGTVLSWGAEGSGSVVVPPGLPPIRAISGGIYHTIAILEDSGPAIFAQGLNPAWMTNCFTISFLREADGFTRASTRIR